MRPFNVKMGRERLSRIQLRAKPGEDGSDLDDSQAVIKPQMVWECLCKLGWFESQFSMACIFEMFRSRTHCVRDSFLVGWYMLDIVEKVAGAGLNMI